jgi:hypothetical protein
VENTSGQGKNALVPPEVRGWNWGAFFCTVIWGLANNVLVALFMLVPCGAFVMPFVLGARGSAWAWQARRWDSIEHFKAVQRRWAQAGFAALGALVVFAVCLLFVINLIMKSSDVYKLSYEQVSRDPVAIGLLGTPLDTGMVQGSIETSGPAGSAEISYSVKGPRARGTLYTQATKTMGRWHLDALELEIEGKPARVPLTVP